MSPARPTGKRAVWRDQLHEVIQRRRCGLKLPPPTAPDDAASGGGEEGRGGGGAGPAEG